MRALVRQNPEPSSEPFIEVTFEGEAAEQAKGILFGKEVGYEAPSEATDPNDDSITPVALARLRFTGRALMLAGMCDITYIDQPMANGEQGLMPPEAVGTALELHNTGISLLSITDSLAAYISKRKRPSGPITDYWNQPLTPTEAVSISPTWGLEQESLSTMILNVLESEKGPDTASVYFSLPLGGRRTAVNTLTVGLMRDDDTLAFRLSTKGQTNIGRENHKYKFDEKPRGSHASPLGYLPEADVILRSVTPREPAPTRRRWWHKRQP